MASRLSSLNRRLAGFGVVLAGVIVVTTGWLVMTLRDDDLAANRRTASELAQVLAEQTSRVLQPVDLMLRVMQQRLADVMEQTPGDQPWGSSKAACDHWTEQLKSLPQVDALIMISADGRLMNCTRNYPAPAWDAKSRDYYQYLSTHDDHGLYISTPSQTHEHGIWTVQLARRVNNAAGEFAGLAVAAVTIGYLEDFYRAVTPREGAVTLLRRDGTMLGRYPASTHQQGFRLPPEAAWYRVVEAGGGSYVTSGYLDGSRRVVSVSPLRDFPLILNSSMSEAAALARWRWVAGWLVVGAGLGVACVYFLLWVFGRQIGRLEQSENSLAQQNAQFEDGRRQFDVVLDNISQGVTFFDRNQKLIVSNRRYREIYRLPPEQVCVGTTLSDILDHRRDSNTFVNMANSEYLARRAEAAAAAGPFDLVDELSDGRIVALHYQPMNGGGWVATHEDITERRRAEASLAFMARHDALTALPNRTLFRERLEQAIAAAGNGTVCALLCLDLDRFKVINDTLGHPVGDGLLRAVAQRLLAAVRGGDTVARLGGDEFAIVQAGLRTPEHASLLAERILEVIQQPFEIDGNRIVVALSVGIAVAADDRIAAETLLKNADIALYISKSQGRGTYRFFCQDMDVKVQELRAVEMELRNARPTEDFELHYQPIVDVKTRALTGFEALLRWNHPVRGRISPASFIPIAEETGMIIPIGDWVLRAAFQEAASWPPHIDVAVNLSPAQFGGALLFETVRQALTASGLQPTRLILEITESVVMQQSDDRVMLLHRLRSLGIRIALDDFGTGYSSLSYLRSFPFDKIKIDKSFIQDVDTNKDSTVIVAAIIGLAGSFGITTVAEGVETERQLATLLDQGCKWAQGYLFSRPVAATELPDLIRILSDIGGLVPDPPSRPDRTMETMPH